MDKNDIQPNLKLAQFVGKPKNNFKFFQSINFKTFKV